MAVPTKKRGKSWHPEMVNIILANYTRSSSLHDEH